ncbi:MAG: hypothetical protein QOF32_1897, partial [Gammaproteobacteria bacterium]|nr:hypothetical protein [Gammaproteobacteria bacterium]
MLRNALPSCQCRAPIISAGMTAPGLGPAAEPLCGDHGEKSAGAVVHQSNAHGIEVFGVTESIGEPIDALGLRKGQHHGAR